MKNPAVVFTGKNRVEVVDMPVPELASDQVLIEADWSLISTGTEGICYARKFEPGSHWDHWVKYPFYPGYSLAGRVAAVGSGVDHLKVGQPVASRVGHRRFTAARAELVLPIPDGVSLQDAPWFGLAKIVQNGVRRARPVMGDRVVVVGLGLLGQLVVQYSRVMGAAEVIAIDTAERRLRMAEDHGATVTIPVPVSEARALVAEATGGRLADIVYDVTGHPLVFPSALGLARKFGQVILLGDAGAPSEQRLTSDVMTRGLTITAAHDGHPPAHVTDENFWTGTNMYHLFFTYLQRGEMRVGDLVTHRFSPLEAPAVYDLLERERQKVMGVLFDWSQVR